MPALVLALLLSAAPEARVIEDPRGFHFTLPAGFEPFPGFTPTASKLYAFVLHPGTPDATVLAIDVLDGPTTAGTASRSCGALLNDMNRTVGKPLTEPWHGVELNGLRMLMTQLFGEIAVYCVDVPVLPNALSVKVSGKPANEALLHETFRAVLGSLETNAMGRLSPLQFGVLAGVALAFFVLGRRARRRTPPLEPRGK